MGITVQTNDPVFLKAREILAKMLKIRPETISPESLLKDDLGIDSVDGLDMAYALEEKFGIEVEDYEVARLKNMADMILLVKKKSREKAKL